uniref:HIRAN domain-containing protein n=1 Tax=Candidatus Kentrum sp. LFY TaxID=2126342 RepID=A0A450UPW8_9GAMM|nr:MAG: hypothetical protein BECKLFY1418B_GA0070995_105914 [Candidatus Kentron sp. LFY]VFJ98581.1 MAG: hypothetical protein BECKLFY1418A_GA0070994_108510 [Candidatus Kentron sp. LFY]
MNTLYLAAQHPDTRRWYTVGRLTRENGHYLFGYTQGAIKFPDFGYLGRMKDMSRIYYSTQLFPTFANRLLNKSRPEYPDYLAWMGLNETASDMELLARSGGQRATDWFCVYPEVEPNKQGEAVLYFFSHGVRHLDSTGQEAIRHLKTGDPLQSIAEDDNPHDPRALLLETAQSVPVGYCPRYLNRGLRSIQDRDRTLLRVEVERANPDAPLQFQLLCKAVFALPEGLDLYATEEHQPLAQEITAG